MMRSILLSVVVFLAFLGCDLRKAKSEKPNVDVHSEVCDAYGSDTVRKYLVSSNFDCEGGYCFDALQYLIRCDSSIISKESYSRIVRTMIRDGDCRASMYVVDDVSECEFVLGIDEEFLSICKAEVAKFGLDSVFYRCKNSSY